MVKTNKESTAYVVGFSLLYYSNCWWVCPSPHFFWPIVCAAAHSLLQYLLFLSCFRKSSREEHRYSLFSTHRIATADFFHSHSKNGFWLYIDEHKSTRSGSRWDRHFPIRKYACLLIRHHTTSWVMWSVPVLVQTLLYLQTMKSLMVI